MSEEKSNSNQLLPVHDTAIAAYLDREEVRELGKRLMALHPDAKKFGETAMMTVAQLAILSGANPLPFVGDIHIWEQRGDLIIDWHINFYRRKAREMDTILWGIEPRNMTVREQELWGAPDDVVAAGICSGSRATEVARLIGLGIPYEVAINQTRRTGVGYVTKDDSYSTKYNKPISPPKGKTWEWVASKRAEKDFYRAQALLYQCDAAHVDTRPLAEKMAAWGIQSENDDVRRLSNGQPIGSVDTGLFAQMSEDELNEALFA